jgi:hypothetical protein
MIAEAVARIQAIEQNLIGKTELQQQVRQTIRSCLTELRDISGHNQPAPPSPDGTLRAAH